MSLGMADWGTSFVKNVFTGLPALALVGSMSTAALAHEEAAAWAAAGAAAPAAAQTEAPRTAAPRSS